MKGVNEEHPYRSSTWTKVGLRHLIFIIKLEKTCRVSLNSICEEVEVEAGANLAAILG